MSTTPSADDTDDLLLSSRYGDLSDVQQFVEQFGTAALNDVRDDGGNTILHMVSGNGHTDVLEYLLPLVSPALLSVQNEAGSTALHWAALNSHLSIAQALVRWPAGPGTTLIDIRNAAGRSPLGEAEAAGWNEGARWFVEVMNLDDGAKGEETVDTAQDIEVEIEDADGQIAKMTLGQRAPNMSKTGTEKT